MTTYLTNKRATFDYEILETFEAGLAILGTEVKSIRAGRGKLDGGHVIVRGGEAFLVGVSIPPFQSTNVSKTYDPERARKLLLGKKELARLAEDGDRKGLTIIPIKLYNKGRLLKLELALVRGKKKFDKRESIKARDTKRDIDRLIKRS